MGRWTGFRAGIVLPLGLLSACASAGAPPEMVGAETAAPTMASPLPPPTRVPAVRYAAGGPRFVAQAAAPPPAPPPARENRTYKWVLCPGSPLIEGGSSYLMLTIYPSRLPSDRKCDKGGRQGGVLRSHAIRSAVRDKADAADTVSPAVVARYEDGAVGFRWLIQPSHAGAMNFSVAVTVLDAQADGTLRPRTQPLPILSNVAVRATGAPSPARAAVIPTPPIDPSAPWWQNAWAILVYIGAAIAAVAAFLRNTDGLGAVLRKWRLLPAGHDDQGPDPTT